MLALPAAAAVILPCASTVIFAVLYVPAVTEVSASLAAVTASLAMCSVSILPSV